MSGYLYFSSNTVHHVYSDYPSFYTRLYAFLDRNLLHLKHRARFFRMTELFLSSTYVETYSRAFEFSDVR